MLKLVWHGTASVELICDNGKIAFDPFIPLKGSAADVKTEDFDGIRDVLITHGHFDHIASLPELYRRNPEMHIWCTQTPYSSLRKMGIPGKSLTKIHFGQVMSLNGFRIETYRGKHAVLPKATVSRLISIFSDRNAANLPAIIRDVIRCREGDETVLYLIEAEGRTITLMGSMNLREDAGYPTGSDILILPYNGWEDNYPPAVRVIEKLNPAMVLLDHYDNTFPPVTSELDLGPIIEKYGERVQTLDYGERIL